MNSGVLGLVVALAAALSAIMLVALLPLLRRYALAHPNARSSHRTSTPQGGGLAVITATIAVAAGTISAGMHQAGMEPWSLWLVLAATAFIAAVGAVDDIRTIEVAPRLLLQTIAVGRGDRKPARRPSRRADDCRGGSNARCCCSHVCGSST